MVKKKIKIGSYVIAITNIDKIPTHSVGLVKHIVGDDVTVFFIGANKTITTNVNRIAFLNLRKTGKPYKKKICNICHLLKDMKEFDINQTDAKGRKTTRPSCQVCRIVIDGKPMSIAENKRLDAIKPKDVFMCPICKKTSIAWITAKFVKDHDHITGQGREWICDSCNTGLGRFKDDIGLLQRAIDYLKKYSAHSFKD